MSPPAPPPPPRDDSKLRKFLFGLLVVIPMGVWIWYVVAAGTASHSATVPADVNATIQLVGVASGTALAVVAGSFLGISNALGTLSVQGVEPVKGGWWKRVTAGIRRPELSVNAWAAVFYFIGIAIAVVIWALDTNRDNSEEVIKTSLATLVGFGLGAFKAATTKPV